MIGRSHWIDKDALKRFIFACQVSDFSSCERKFDDMEMAMAIFKGKNNLSGTKNLSSFLAGTCVKYKASKSCPNRLNVVCVILELLIFHKPKV